MLNRHYNNNTTIRCNTLIKNCTKIVCGAIYNCFQSSDTIYTLHLCFYYKIRNTIFLTTLNCFYKLNS